MKRMLLVIIFVLCSSSLQMKSVRSTEFEVGGDKGWSIPRSRQEEDRDLYNEWASKHRFKINDTLRFKYEKDSVLVVMEEEYDKCKASHPIFFSNNEDTVFRLDRSGLFYFISGVSGHCERGQKMIIKVLEEPEHHKSQPPSSSGSPNHNHNADPKTSGSYYSSAAACYSTVTLLLLLLGILPFLG